ncbi:MAG: ABC transporter permease [bacterium]|nr:ABC transporter permease [bacterium]
MSKELVWFLPLSLVTVAILVLVRLMLPRLWAVARQTVAEAVRMKIAVFFLVLMVLGFCAATRASGDGSLTGRVQAYLVYSLTTVSVLLALLSIFLSRSLSDELVNRQILMLMAKPLSRWQFLLGKWLGIVLLNAGLLIMTGTGIYLTVVLYLARQPAMNEYDHTRLREEVLTARHASPFDVPDDQFNQQAKVLYQKNLEEGTYDERPTLDPDAEKALLYKYVDARWRYVPTGEARTFRFSNVLCDRDPEKYVQVRYKAEARRYPPDEILRSRWGAGNPQAGTPAYVQDVRHIVGRYHTMNFNADAVGEDRTLYVTFINRNMFPGEQQFDNMFLFEGDRAIEVLFEVGTFGGNLIRLLVLIQCKLMFLAAVAIMFATVFSFPVAVLCSLTVYVLASLRQFLDDAIGFLESGGATGLYKTVFPWLLEGLYLVIPNFGDYDGIEVLADGRNVSLAWVLLAILWLVVIGTTLASLLGCVLFYRREVSEVSV